MTINKTYLYSAVLALTVGIASTLVLMRGFTRASLSKAEVVENQLSSKPSATITEQSDDVNYKVARKNPDTTDVGLSISIAPDCFVREKMTRLASNLNEDFPDARRLNVDIFDDEELARNSNEVGAAYSLVLKVMRGQYYLDRAKGEEVILFSTRRGKPVNEVILNFGRTRPKWLKKQRRQGKRTARKLVTVL